MTVGLCTVELLITDSDSLKDKRQVVKSLKDRIRNRFNVSVAELDGHETWQSSTLGFACIGNGRAIVEQTLNKVLDHVEGEPRAMVVRCDMEML